jgi:hypothetical protein
MNPVALYELANGYRELLTLADSGDVPMEVIRDTLEGLQGDIEVKAVQVAKFALGLDATADQIDAAAKAMTERANRVRKRSEQIRAYLLLQMQMTGINKVECPEFTLAVRKTPDVVQIMETAVIPPEYMVQPPAPAPKPDKVALKAALKAGVEIPGVYLQGGERLEVKL